MEKQVNTSNEFQRVYRVEKSGSMQAKPRAIIAHFLWYTVRETVFSRHSCLDKESGLGIGPDLHKEVIKRKMLIPKMLEARRRGSRENVRLSAEQSNTCTSSSLMAKNLHKFVLDISLSDCTLNGRVTFNCRHLMRVVYGKQFLV